MNLELSGRTALAPGMMETPMAAPVFNRMNRPIAAIWITAPTDRLPECRFTATGKQVAEHASRISARFGSTNQPLNHSHPIERLELTRPRIKSGRRQPTLQRCLRIRLLRVLRQSRFGMSQTCS